jgi:hypothetical protein
MPTHEGRRPAASLALAFVLLMSVWPSASRAGFYEKGSLSLSIGGSLAYKAIYDREYGDTSDLPEEERKDKQSDGNYSDADFSLYLSGGYFPANKFEVGLSLSTMLTWYFSTSQSDSTMNDAQLFAKYYFGNSMTWTPYAKLKGGLSVTDTGDYEETDYKVGVSGGLQFSGTSPLSWFLELSSDYKLSTGDLRGREWQNQIYAGVSWYPRFGAQARARAEAMQMTLDTVPGLDAEMKRAVLDSEARWGKRLDRLDERLNAEREAP